MRTLFVCCVLILPSVSSAQTPVDIGSRRELFVDSQLIERLENAELRLHHPIAQDLAIVHDAPWEGSGSAYHCIFHDGERYRMYYRGSALEVSKGKLRIGSEACCYAESQDGIHWNKPELGLIEHNGSKKNNIVWTGVGVHNFTPFMDTRPDCPPEARFKAIAGDGAREGGLLVFQSADGFHWSKMHEDVVISNGAFDSQNLAFWDPVRGEYRAYWRYFTGGVTTKEKWAPEGIRAVRTATSPDLIHWDHEADLAYEDSPDEELYTNQIRNYHRAPHLMFGFPARYLERGWSESMKALPEPEHRKMRADIVPRYGTGLSDGLLMVSRDGVNFKRWNEAFLRPGPERPGTWHYGHQFIGWHLVETPSALPGAVNELSLYASESGWTGDSNALRRYTLRLDGFVSVNAPAAGGDLVTKPIVFSGSRLELNFSTSVAGSVRVEIQEVDGTPIEGFTLADSPEHFGDSVNRKVTWTSGADLGSLQGKAVRLRFRLADADLYAYQFVGE